MMSKQDMDSINFGDESDHDLMYHIRHDLLQKQWMRPAVTYTPYATSSKEQTGNIITFAQFEEGDILTETRNDAESGD